MPRILMVDDEPSIRMSVARYLRGLGHEVHLADTGDVALATLQDLEIDLVITDINMPDKDGIEIIIAIRDMGSDIPIVAISGGGRLGKEHLLEDAGHLGATTTLAKPFDVDALRRAVEGALARRG